MIRISLPAGWRFYSFDKIGSTNAFLKENPNDKTIVQADVQTAGRGRLQRTWISPAGNLYCSVCLHVDNASAASGFGFLTSLAVCETLESFESEVRFACKWPNDVLANGKKIAGILLELIEKDGALFLIVGVGVNVAFYPNGINTLYEATSLQDEGVAVSLETLAERFVQKFDIWTRRLEKNGLPFVLDGWKRRACGIGGPVRVSLCGKTRYGIFSGLDKDGALLLYENGRTDRITAGDVFFDNERKKDAD